MRHLGSLVFGLVSVPIIWVLFGIGLVRFNGGIANDLTGDMIVGFVAIVAVAGLLAALLLPRWSPVGTVVAGLFFLVMALWTMVDFRSMADLLPRSVFGVNFALTAPAGAFSTLMAVLLGATLLVPQRWRSPRAAAAGLPGGTGQPGFPPHPPAGQPAPGGQFPYGQFPPGGPAAHPPNYGPSGAPNHAQSAPPNFGPAVPPNYGPVAPHHQTPSAPPYNAPSAPPQPPSFGPPQPPTYSPLTPPVPAPRAGQPSSDETTQFGGRSDETTQFSGGRDDDGMDGVTRRLGDR